MNQRWLYILPLRLRSLFRPGRVEQELDDEIQFHIERLIEMHVRNGLTPEEARRAALRAMDGVDQRKEECRDLRGVRSVEELRQDLRYAFRLMRRSPGFTFIAVLSLALGIGANSSIFSVLNAVTLKALPVQHPEELFAVKFESRLPSAQRFSYPMFERLRGALALPDAVAAMSRVARMRTVIAGSEPETASVQLVSPEYFSVLGIAPAIGRVFIADDDRVLGGHPVAVLSHRFWRQRFSEAPDIIGRDVTLNGTRFTIVGVGTPGFSGVWLESPVDCWIPLMMQGPVRYGQSFSASDADTSKPWVPQARVWWLDLVVRAARGDHATAALNALFRDSILQEAQTVSDPKRRELFLQQRLRLEPFERGYSALRQQFVAPLWALMGMVAVLLLIACANTANLLLARATVRQREMAIRLSIGASRGRLVQQLVTESVVMAAIACIGGLVLAQWSSDLLVRMTMGIAAGPSPFAVGIDLHVLEFTVAVSAATAVLFGLAPAFRSTELTPATALKPAALSVPGGSKSTAAKLLVVGQIALSLLLVVAAGLFLRSLRNLATLDLGYDREHIVSARIDPRNADMPAPELAALYKRIIERAERVPGVNSVTIAMCGLVAGCRANADGIEISGYTHDPAEQVLIQENRVGARYFTTLGMALIAGRDFDSRDFASTPNVAVVNEAMVRRYFARRSPIGERFGYGKPDIEIVGVVRDARVNSVREGAVPMAFYPLQLGSVGAGALDVRTAADPRAVAAALRKTMTEVDARLPVDRVTILADQVNANLNQDRLIANLAAVFGALALGLVCVGLYGVMSHTVARRTSEIGIRMALGASRPSVLRLVFRESLALTLAGVAIGIPAALATTRLVSALLFGVGTTDALTMGVAVCTMVAVAAIAGFLPARRASGVDPIVALRCE